MRRLPATLRASVGTCWCCPYTLHCPQSYRYATDIGLSWNHFRQHAGYVYLMVKGVKLMTTMHEAGAWQVPYTHFSRTYMCTLGCCARCSDTFCYCEPSCILDCRTHHTCLCRPGYSPIRPQAVAESLWPPTLQRPASQLRGWCMLWTLALSSRRCTALRQGWIR